MSSYRTNMRDFVDHERVGSYVRMRSASYHDFNLNHSTRKGIAMNASRIQANGVCVQHIAGRSSFAADNNGGESLNKHMNTLKNFFAVCSHRTKVMVFGILFIVVSIFGVSLMAHYAQAQPEHLQTIVERVQPGDSLWGFALKIQGNDESIDDAIARIMRFNNLTSEHLELGQRILLPVENPVV